MGHDPNDSYQVVSWHSRAHLTPFEPAPVWHMTARSSIRARDAAISIEGTTLNSTVHLYAVVSGHATELAPGTLVYNRTKYTGTGISFCDHTVVYH